MILLEPKAQTSKSGERYAIMTAYVLSLLGLFTAFATNFFAMIIATATLIASERESAGFIESKRILFKNGAIFIFGTLPLLWITYSLISMVNTSMDDITLTSLITSAAIGLLCALAIFALKIYLLVDFVRYLNEH